MVQVEIYTDGACKGNPGPGGWGALLVCGNRRKELYGFDPDTTNNRMELTAVIEALAALKRPCRVRLYTDSQYVQKGMTEWMPKWQKKRFSGVRNDDLWRRLLELAAVHEIEWIWVRGHQGNPGNERADKLANYAILEATA